MHRSVLFLFVFLSIVAVFLGCARVRHEKLEVAPEQLTELEQTSSGIREGERFKFSVRWLGFEVGTAEVKVEGIEKVQGRDAYHISVFARSNSLIDIVYPVRDEHHSYVDVEHLHSLRYEKTLREGRYRANEMIEYNQDEHFAIHHSLRSGTKKRLLIPKHSQDPVSAAFWFRTQQIRVGESVHIPVNSEEKNWDFEVHILELERVDIKELGTFEAFRVHPDPRFQGIFLSRGQIEGWMSADENRLPLMMKTKIPILGRISAVLVEYDLGS